MSSGGFFSNPKPKPLYYMTVIFLAVESKRAQSKEGMSRSCFAPDADLSTLIKGISSTGDGGPQLSG